MSNVKRFGATGDGTTDDTAAIEHAVRDGDGMLHFPPGTYRITRPVEIPLRDRGPCGIDGTSGTARILVAGPGPAFRLIGTHGGTGDPSSVQGNVFPAQRLPTIQNIDIEGEHPEADGIQLVRTMQAVLAGVLIHGCRHGIHLPERNRNVLISHCHIYHNRGAGVFLDHLNLHQINIIGNHISYNRLGGIRIIGSEVRNLQITGNDIEYNNHARHGTEPEPTAEIYVDTTAPGASVNEVTVASNTIQATPSDGGCNLRIRQGGEPPGRPPGLWTITGNIIGNQENNVHLTGCYGISLSGNCIYSCGHRNLLIEDSRQIDISGNTFRRHTPRLGTGVRIVRSRDITLTGGTLLDEAPEGQASGASLLELVDCERVNISGCQLLDGVPYGLDATDCRHVNVTGCTIRDGREPPRSRHAVRFTGTGHGNLLAMNSIGRAVDAPLSIARSAGVHQRENLLDEGR